MKYDKSNPKSIALLFDDIAKNYDLGNSLMSWNIHTRWNKKLVEKLFSNTPTEHFLDLCAGTGAITESAFKYHKKSKMSLPKTTLVDFSENMLKVAKSRLENRHPFIEFCCHDAEDLPFANDTFDRVAIAYGIRNVNDVDKCFDSVFRTLKPGGVFGILELVKPKNSLLQKLHGLYLKMLIPLIGKFCTSNKDAYEYLNQSIKNFSVSTIVQKLQRAGFSDIEAIPLTFGTASLILCKKNQKNCKTTFENL